MVLCLGAFPPSPTFAPYLKVFCDNHKDDEKEEIAKFASFALQQIDKVTVIGPRHEVPTSMELEVAQNMEKLPQKIYFLDGTFKEVEISPWDPSTGLGVKISQSFPISFCFPFSFSQLRIR